MALTPLAAVGDLEARLGHTLTAGTVDRARAEAALADASSLIRAETGSNWLADDGVTLTAPDPVVTITIHAALRGYRNPDGFASENLGEYGYRLDAVGVYLTEEEKRVLGRFRKGWTGTGSIRTRSAYATENGTFVYYAPTDNPDADPIPLTEG